MPRKAVPVEGVYEREAGSGFLYARSRVKGKLVRKSFGRNGAEAVRYVEKARTVRHSGEGVVPDTSKRPVLIIRELDVLGGVVTINELCDDYLSAYSEPA